MGKWKRGDFVAHRVDCHNRSYKRKINKLSPIYSKNKKWVGVSRVSHWNRAHRPGGGKVVITNRKLKWNAKAKVTATNDSYKPSGERKVTIWNKPHQWSLTAKSKIGSFDNIHYTPKRYTEFKVPDKKLTWKENGGANVKPRINNKHDLEHGRNERSGVETWVYKHPDGENVVMKQSRVHHNTTRSSNTHKKVDNKDVQLIKSGVSSPSISMDIGLKQTRLQKNSWDESTEEGDATTTRVVPATIALNGQKGEKMLARINSTNKGKYEEKTNTPPLPPIKGKSPKEPALLPKVTKLRRSETFLTTPNGSQHSNTPHIQQMEVNVEKEKSSSRLLPNIKSDTAIINQ